MGNNWDYKNNGNGTHDVICKDCGTTVTFGVACNHQTGTCACGSEKCNHMGNHWKYEDNGDGTHKVICKDCKDVVTVNAKCVWESGACACGSTKPTKKVITVDPNLDSVPKTGSFFLEWLYNLIFG